MKLFRLLGAGLLLLLGGCSTHYSLTEQQIASYIDKEVSFEQRLAVPGLLNARASLTDIRVTLGRSDDKAMDVEGQTRITVANPFFPIDARVSAAFSAEPYYEPSEGAVYLRNVQLRKLQTEPDHMAKAVEALVPQAVAILRNYLETQPVYVLDDSNWKEASIKQVGKSLEIRDHTLYFNTGL